MTPPPLPNYTNDELIAKTVEHLTWLRSNHLTINSPANKKVVNQLMRLNTLMAKRGLAIPKDKLSTNHCTCAYCSARKTI